MERAGAALKSPLLKSVKPSENPRFPFFPLLVSFAALFFLIAPTPSAAAEERITSSNFLTYYSKHCAQIVSESPITSTRWSSDSGEGGIVHFDIAYFTGGHQFIPKRLAGDSPVASLSFFPSRSRIFLTQAPHLLNLQAILKFRFRRGLNLTSHRNLREIRFRGPRLPVRERSLNFDLYGFLSRSDGKLCMVGSGKSHTNLGAVSSLSVVFKLDYPNSFSNISSLISGVLESLNYKDNLGYFDPISILGIPNFGEYKYTLIDKGIDMCFSRNGESSVRENENLNPALLDSSMCLSQLYTYARNLELEYGNDCDSKNSGRCNPLGGAHEILPKFVTIEGISCDHGGAIRVLIGFSNSDYYASGHFGYDKVFDPNTMLIGEGVWDEKNKNRICMVACQVLNFKDSLAEAFVGDCSIRLSLTFMTTLTIRDRSTVVGEIWSNRTVNDAGYFNRIGFHGSGNKMMRPAVPGLKYEYTVLDRVPKSCAASKIVKGKGKMYPNGYSSDMKFQMLVKNGKGQTAQGNASPLFVDDQLYAPFETNKNHSGPLNMSYKLSFTTASDFMLGYELFPQESVHISAEGMYNNEAGVLCMIGCRHLISHIEKTTGNDSVDCDIVVNFQFSPLNALARSNIKGTITSMRQESDPLYFGKLEISSNSIYTHQAAESIWRTDMEITMVLISNTLACVFVGLQLYHAKKYPDVIPFISIVMLVVLTLGHMIPLLLNFEAMFMADRNKRNVFIGWLEVNEVLVRLVTMIAFLLHFRLLQLTWSTRKSDASSNRLWLSEGRVTCLSLPFYIGGALVAWYIYRWNNSYKNPYLQPRFLKHFQQQYSWNGLKSYAGLILDGFLLPQILFNLFSNTTERALAAPFYVGTTIIRLLPHAYDLYRAHSSTWYLDLSYIYANHRQDFYSTAWDIVIPCGGLLFAGLIYLQQRFGGRCIFPRRFRDSEYEKVPVINGEELQEDAIR